MMIHTIAVGLLVLSVSGIPVFGQEVATQHADDPNPTALVRIVAYSTHGPPLDPPDVDLFEDLRTAANLATQFHKGVAHTIPFGTYLLRAHKTGFYDTAVIVRVARNPTTVVVGFQLGRIDNPGFPYLLRGRVIGRISPDKAAFAQLLGVFSGLSMQSDISPNGEFEFVGLSNGLFVLLVANEDGILAARQLDFGGRDKPEADGRFEINIGQGDLLPPRK